jgi:SAM-dependent methyltransferase
MSKYDKLAGQTIGHAIRDQISVLNIAEGFFNSSILFALLKLRIFELIGKDERSVDELAVATGANPVTLMRLLNAGVVLNLLENRPERKYRLTSITRSTLLPTVHEGYIGSWIQNLAYFQMVMSDLDAAVLSSAPAIDPSHHLGSDQQQTESFTLAMHDYAALRGKELAQYLDTSGCESLLDLGCGPGTYGFNLGLVNPDLKLHMLDLPGVLRIAKLVQVKFSIRNVIQYIPMDILSDEIPGQYDIVLVSNILHMLGHEASSELIKRLYKSVKPEGSLVIQAQFLRDDMMGERWPILLDLIQLCITTNGANHSVEQTRRWMEEAGFRCLELCSMTLLNSNSYLRGYKM